MSRLFKESKQEQPKDQPLNSQFTEIMPDLDVDINPYDELIRSLPEEERDDILAELDSQRIIARAELLYTELSFNKRVGLNLDESRTLFLAALRNLKYEKISVAQLATLHILDSAIRTLYTNPTMYLIHKFVGADRKVAGMTNTAELPNSNGIPTSVTRCIYSLIFLPKEDMSVSDLPHRMQKPLMKRFFNFTDSEWNNFCSEMAKASPSEQMFNILIAPEYGCYSSIISRIQKVMKCMCVLDRWVDSEKGFVTENIMPIPSFSMFQAAINAKAHTFGRKSVELIATYGYIEAERYAALKASGKIALAMYMPEKNPSERYSNSGRFRTTIDGHPQETAFAGAIHDVYHAMREISMSENVAKARWRLASIARANINNKLHSTSRPVDDILVDGELIYSYSPSIDT